MDPAGVLPDKVFHVRINFLSSSSVSAFTVYTPELPELPDANFTYVEIA